MIYIFDSYYTDTEANTACVGISHWDSTTHAVVLSRKTVVSSDYISGQFYKRELPGILQIISELVLQPGDIIVIDGYVYLDDQLSNGLGGYLYEELGRSVPVLGVAKNKYRTLDRAYREVHRGKSSKPLFITAAGIDLDDAVAHLQQMAGAYRLPDMLKLADMLSKGYGKTNNTN